MTETEQRRPLRYEPLLGRDIRDGPWADQGVSTDQKIREAIATRNWDDVATLAGYFVTEAGVCYKLYRQWRGDLTALLAEWGVPQTDIDELEAGLALLLEHPDGRAFDAQQQWQRVLGAAQDLADAAHAVNAASAADAALGAPPARLLPLLDDLRETWRQCHDRDVDMISGVMDQFVRRFGESSIGPMYDRILRPWFEARYAMFDVDQHPWADATRVNLHVAFEAMRGHLCGPGRRGDVEFEETDDRYVLRFDPCGSGGRSVRGDAIEGTPPRDQAPYNWPLTREPAAWNHFEPGVCTYCAHCVMLTEIMPMEAFGYPVRAVDPPRPVPAGATPQRCSWTMFKDLAAVPDEYYTRVGRIRPPVVGSGACGGVPERRSAPRGALPPRSEA